MNYTRTFDDVPTTIVCISFFFANYPTFQSTLICTGIIHYTLSPIHNVANSI